MRVVSGADVESLRGRRRRSAARDRSQAATTRPSRLRGSSVATPSSSPLVAIVIVGRQRRARRDRGRQRPLERPAGPVEARRADVRPADRRLRPDRHGPARPVPARAAPGRRVRRGPQARPRRDDDGRGPLVLGEPRASTRRRSCRAVAENASGSSDRGASTITQQLVRARLLPPDVDRAGRRPLHPQGQGADPVVAGHRPPSRARPASSRSSRPT